MRAKAKAAVRIALSTVLGALGVAACRPAPKPSPTPPPTDPIVPESDATGIDVVALREHVEFLADDAQQGRPPGTEADVRVQQYVERVMKQGGLGPAFGQGYRQSLDLTDGVRIREDGGLVFDISGLQVPRHVLPFTSDTSESGPAVGALVFVGYGIPNGGPGTGDYETIEDKVKGKIAVALHGGPDDPHLTNADTRPQSKAIAARDHGAIGFVLWDPHSDVPFPNHGAVHDLQLPAVAVTAEGTPALLEAFLGGKKAKKLSEAERFELEATGLKVGRTSRKRATLRTDVEPVQLTTANVAGVVEGDGSTDRIVVIGAHMDHLGLGTASSLAPGEKAIHNGADDNASGVAVMLEVCGALAELPAEERPYDVICMAFAAEEMGLLGSKHYVEKLDPSMRDKIVAMLNFDMVGRLREDGLTVSGIDTSSVWSRLVEKTRGQLKVNGAEGGYGPSDHGSFYEHGIPVLHFFTGPHEDYHKPSDDIDKINFEGAASVGTMAYAIVTTLLADRIEPDYKETARPKPRGGFRVSLGTIPDYAAKVDGVRLSGVRKGGPADEAGLRKGDVIVMLAEREVHNLDDYMAAFATMKPGEAVKVVVQRGGKRVTLELVPGAPRRPK